MRRLLWVVTLMAVFATVLAAPAMAGKPAPYFFSTTFTDVNPCTGLEHEITINSEGFIHEHQNNLVVKAHRSGFADDGSTMVAGTETFVANKGGERATAMDQWRNPAGFKYMVHINYKVNYIKGEVQVFSVRLTCIGNS